MLFLPILFRGTKSSYLPVYRSLCKTNCTVYRMYRTHTFGDCTALYPTRSPPHPVQRWRRRLESPSTCRVDERQQRFYRWTRLIITVYPIRVTALESRLLSYTETLLQRLANETGIRKKVISMCEWMIRYETPPQEDTSKRTDKQTERIIRNQTSPYTFTVFADNLPFPFLPSILPLSLFPSFPSPSLSFIGEPLREGRGNGAEGRRRKDKMRRKRTRRKEKYRNEEEKKRH